MRRQFREVYGFVPQRRERFPMWARLVLTAAILGMTFGGLL